MRFDNIDSLAGSLRKIHSTGPLAIVLAEDAFGLVETVEHLNGLGFARTIVFGQGLDLALLPSLTNCDLVEPTPAQKLSMPQILNRLMPVLAGQWIHACYNGEFLYYPFCEDRQIGDALAFNDDERRKSVFGYMVDLYADSLDSAAQFVPREQACFDRVGYFDAPPIAGLASDPRMPRLNGGLRWRFSEHIPLNRQNINKVAMFRADPKLSVSPDMEFSLPEYNSVSCQWHHNMTMAIASFRVAKALRTNPESDAAIAVFHWDMSERFEWNSKQLMQAGFIEPGQWF